MKRIFIILGFLFAALQSMGQNSNRSKFGIKGGYNVAWITGTKGDFSPSSKNGFMVSGFMSRGSESGFGYRTELVFSRQGFSFTDDGDDKSISHDYIYLPQLTTFTIGKFLQLQAGGQIGYLINAKADKKTEEDLEKKLIDYYNRIDFGFAGGVEVFPFKGLIVGARYNASLGNIYKKMEVGSISPLPVDPSELKGKNAVVQIFAGYRF